MDIYVVGKQWMWKFQHPEGNREINELHVPTGRPIRLTMTSEDTIHSMYVPAFRMKQDVVPGRYQTTWFQATKPGRYHLFCAEYCGTQHSGMVGSVFVMEPRDYEAWLAGDTSGGSMASRGEKLFNQLGCVTCTCRMGVADAPPWSSFWKPVQLITGEQVVADEGIRINTRPTRSSNSLSANHADVPGTGPEKEFCS
jgi:cytochrome c oxidase subunit 2